ncbi:hypothetical protein [Bosea sp. BK604]|uniref:hypothetical protein n=1 Tax=Bosea sp. BK604 TaxID=2512180 RepID=UPI0010EEBB5E|nr:hypothetical protein [Bosea sp. BK604]TCR64685.1 hypothetical protein EV560_106151 [Bosea sp. BK604]
MLEEQAAEDEALPLPPTIERDEHGRVAYEPDGVTLGDFMRSDARVRIIRGPIRSGTSSMCCMEIWRRACEQAPGPDGARRTRWAVVRNTYPDLQQSTVKTWLAWFPENQFGRFIWSKPMVHTMRKGDVHCEVVFIALDKPEDVSKLRSTEWTGIWFNELEYIPKELFDEAESRAGYYPAVKDGGPTWSGIFGDMNAPSEDNWVVMMTGEVPLPDDMSEDDRRQYQWPKGWDYFVQPTGLLEVFGPDGKTVDSYKLNPKAENLRWIPRINGKALYLETIKGKTKRWIDSRIMNRITAPINGTPVFPMFVEETHVAKVPLRYNPNWPLHVGLDFGRRPAAVFGQLINDRWQIIGELYGTDQGATVFAPRVGRWIIENCPGLLDGGDMRDFESAIRLGRLKLHGDPKGADKVQSDESTAYDVFRDHGLRVVPAPVPSNSIKTRLDAVEFVLNGMRDGMPRFLMSPNARRLKMAMAGGYHFKKGDFQKVEPNKDANGYSDVADALQYLMLGGGEGGAMTGRSRPGATSTAPVQVYKGRRSLRRVRAWQRATPIASASSRKCGSWYSRRRRGSAGSTGSRWAGSSMCRRSAGCRISGAGSTTTSTSGARMYRSCRTAPARSSV